MISTEFRDLIKDFEKYKTINIEFHAGDLLEHSAWAAFYVNDLFTSLDMDNPLHRVWNQTIVDDAELYGVTIDYEKVLILSAFLHDIGKGGDGKTPYYDKPDHEKEGADYIYMNKYRDINSNLIDLDKMFKDFNLTQLEIDIIMILIEGHWLLDYVMENAENDREKVFIDNFEKIYTSRITDTDNYLFKLVAMMQLIICIADVMATKKYEGHSTNIADFPQIPYMNNAPHHPNKYIYEDSNYDTIVVWRFVPLFYQYLDTNYSGGPSVSPIEGIISNISSVQTDVVESFLRTVGKLNNKLRYRLMMASITNKRYDIAVTLYDYIITNNDISIMNDLIKELLNQFLLNEFIAYIKREDKYRIYVSIILNKIIEESMVDGIVVFSIYHREFLTLDALQKAKETYIKARKEGKIGYDAKDIYNEIKDNYNVPDGFFKDEKHKEFCEEIDPDNYPEPLIETTKKITFKIPCIISGFRPKDLTNPPPKIQVSLSQVLSYDNYGGKSSSLFGDDFTLDIEWVYKCIKYMENLSIEDKHTVLGYTYNGDELMNLLLMNNIPKLKSKLTLIKNNGKTNYKKNYFPIFFQLIKIIKDDTIRPDIKRLIEPAPISLFDIKLVINNSDLTSTYLYILENLEHFTDELYGECIRMAVLDLNRILNNAPAMTKTSILYRGVKDKYYYSDPSRRTFQSNTFISTSFNPEAAFQFADKKCCFKKIIAGPGTRGLFMEAITQMSEEREILLNVGTKFNIIDDKDKLYLQIDERTKLEDICSSKGNQIMNITTMEIVP